jgi:hypothetical protein
LVFIGVTKVQPILQLSKEFCAFENISRFEVKALYFQHPLDGQLLNGIEG